MLSRDVIRVLAAGAMWRFAHTALAGRALVRALGARSEDARMMAGMFLTRSGRTALPLLREAMKRQENLPTVITIVGSIGDHSMESELRRFASDSDPQVARAARDSLRVLGAGGA